MAEICNFCMTRYNFGSKLVYLVNNLLLGLYNILPFKKSVVILRW